MSRVSPSSTMQAIIWMSWTPRNIAPPAEIS